MPTLLQILAGYGANFDVLNDRIFSQGWSGMHYAAQKGYDKICQFLAQRGSYLRLSELERRKTSSTLKKNVSWPRIYKNINSEDKIVNLIE